jgi:hypothetical protein
VVNEVPAEYNSNNYETIYHLSCQRLQVKEDIGSDEPERYEILQTEMLESRVGWTLLEPWFKIQAEPGLSSSKRRERIICEIRRSYFKEYHNLCPATRQGPDKDILNWFTKRSLQLDSIGTRREGESDNALQGTKEVG